MRIVTWNVNSIRAREEKVLAWTQANEPDILCLQETKVVDDDFPVEAFREIGYRAETYGQKTYNGVAILSREEATDVVRGFGDGADPDPQARLIRATVGGVRVVNAYVVNGESLDSDKYAYKLEWMARLGAMLASQEDSTGHLVLVGDFNVAPEGRDTWDAEYWRDRLFTTEAERGALRGYLDWGLTDTLRMHHDEEGIYSWWDYRRLAFAKRRGLRIDLVLATDSLARRCTDCRVDKDARRGKGTSDHAPVVADFDL